MHVIKKNGNGKYKKRRQQKLYFIDADLDRTYDVDGRYPTVKITYDRKILEIFNNPEERYARSYYPEYKMPWKEEVVQ